MPIATEFRDPLGSGSLSPAPNDGDGYKVDQAFGAINPDYGGYHLGVDWNGDGGKNTDLGDPVFAVAAAEVVTVVADQSGATSGFGNYVVLRHDLPAPMVINGQTVTQVYSLYAHLDTVAGLSVGQSVAIGQQIGTLGASGAAEGIAHLHFEMTIGDVQPDELNGYHPDGPPSAWIDPISFIDDFPIEVPAGNESASQALFVDWYGSLWVTDGTDSGTQLLLTGNGQTRASHFASLDDGRVLFTGYDDDHGLALWVSDGTTTGTHIVVDMYPDDLGGSYFADLTSLGAGRMLFTADDMIHGFQLWITDGTAAGTHMIREIVPGSEGGSIFDQPSALGDGRALVSVDDGVHGRELWITDGTEAGTYLVRDIWSGAGDGVGAYSSDPTPLGNGTALFMANDGVHGNELWITDGTAAGTHILLDIATGSAGGSYPRRLTSLEDGRVLFMANDGVHGGEVWISDGTVVGTHMVRDINPDGRLNPDGLGSLNQNFVSLGDGRAVFVADDGTHGNKLWVTDGSESGTQILGEVGWGTISGRWPGNIAAITSIGDGKALFFANNQINGWELWVTDGTADGTHMVRDIGSGSDSGIPLDFGHAPQIESIAPLGGGRALFTAYKDGGGSVLWITDGTAAGTHPVQTTDSNIAGFPHDIIAIKKAETSPFADIVPWGVSTSHTLSVGAIIEGTIDAEGMNGPNDFIDKDWYRVTLEGGATYRFTGNADIDTADTLDEVFIRLMNSQGRPLQPDVTAEGSVADLTYSVPGSGAQTYYLAVSAGGDGEWWDDTGSYSLSLVDEGVASPTNHRPDAQASDWRGEPGTSIPLTELFSYSDPDGLSDIVSFAVQDRTSGGGYLAYQGQQMDSNVVYERSITEIGDWAFVAGPPGTDYVGFNAIDSEGAYNPSVVASVSGSLVQGPQQASAEDLFGQQKLSTLAEFALAAYPSNEYAADMLRRDGWRIVDEQRAETLGISGIQGNYFHHYNASAILAEAPDGNSIIISFTGTNSGFDWANNLIDIDDHFDLFASLLSSLDVQEFLSDSDRTIYVTGHSLGAAMAQKFVQEYSSMGNVIGVGFSNPGLIDESDRLDKFASVLLSNDPIREGADIRGLNTSGDLYFLIDAYGDSIPSLGRHGMSRYQSAAEYLDKFEGGIFSNMSDGLDRIQNYFVSTDSDGFVTGPSAGAVTPSGPSWEAPSALSTSLLRSHFSVSTVADSTPQLIISSSDFTELGFQVEAYGNLVELQDLGSGETLIYADEYESLRFSTRYTPMSLLLQSLAGTDILNRTVYFDGGLGTDLVDGSTTDRRIVATGGAGSDTLIGGTEDDDLSGDVGDDSIVGGAGNDKLIGGVGTDTLSGGAGNDVYIVDGGDRVWEAPNAGIDTVRSSATFHLGANVENLVLTGSAAIKGVGNAGHNRINGNSAANWLNGNGGNDILAGGHGNDVYIVDGGDSVWEPRNGGIDTVESRHSMTLGNNFENLKLLGTGNLRGNGNELANQLFGNAGDNTLAGRSGNDRLWGGSGDDRLWGGAGGDRLIGGAGRDRLLGGSGNDVIYGSGGRDLLRGDSGSDRLHGGIDGAQRDVFIFRASDDSAVGSARDRIYDFRHAADAIDLRAIDSNLNLRGNQRFEFSRSGADEYSVWTAKRGENIGRVRQGGVIFRMA